MKKLVEYIVQELVSDQKAIEITEEKAEDTVTIKVSVAPADMGRIIGKQGRIAKAIRTIVRSAAKDDLKYNVDIVDKE